MKNIKKVKPNWKQWIPLYGIYQVYKDHRGGKESLADSSNPIRYTLSSTYHGSCIGLIKPILNNLENLLR